MSDPRGWRKQEETIEAAKAEILAKLAESGGAVKSVQRGVITIAKGKTSATATINPVDMDKATIVPIGDHLSGVAANSQAMIYELTNATTITIKIASTHSYNILGAYQIVEFY